MDPVHHRRPVVLGPDQAEAWLDPEAHNTEELLALVGPAREDVLTMHEVSSAVKSTDNDGPALIEPTEQQRLF